ncbi:unnamed protein product [Ostreobium quekettii]|uniref:DWNN domain-containing protein n=1 Tax=Ostreobium quekettii TaxID=121088 RepID=A0A8S1JDM3_9CHLO|nr:unnamed protein product [Ostreobium quekettii]
MASYVYFRFACSTDMDVVRFDGEFITAGELKYLVERKTGVHRDRTVVLELYDPSTGERYTRPGAVIQKCKSVIAKRSPRVKPPSIVAKRATGTAAGVAVEGKGDAEEKLQVVKKDLDDLLLGPRPFEAQGEGGRSPGKAAGDVRRAGGAETHRGSSKSAEELGSRGEGAARRSCARAQAAGYGGVLSRAGESGIGSGPTAGKGEGGALTSMKNEGGRGQLNAKDGIVSSGAAGRRQPRGEVKSGPRWGGPSGRRSHGEWPVEVHKPVRAENELSPGNTLDKCCAKGSAPWLGTTSQEDDFGLMLPFIHELLPIAPPGLLKKVFGDGAPVSEQQWETLKKEHSERMVRLRPSTFTRYG